MKRHLETKRNMGSDSLPEYETPALAQRRKVMRNLLVASGGTVATTQWIKPVVSSVILPAHAVASNAKAEDLSVDTIDTSGYKFNEVSQYDGKSDVYIERIPRRMYFLKNRCAAYGKKILIVFESGVTLEVSDACTDVALYVPWFTVDGNRSRNGEMYRWGGAPNLPNRINRLPEIYARAGDTSSYVTVYYNQ